ncbi:unnamed protein product [Mycena citricolor]|uniref:Uncharacterized protein n=1 Tax=Mycena citricolor TaxID=2018698 RepID=A0AAD2K1N9_9AGAR|nr:unnamed protein product [Mycena citricolor]
MRPGPAYGYPHSFHSWHGPRRFVWFFIGAASATLWMKHKEAHRYPNDRYFGHCYRPAVPALQPRADATPPPASPDAPMSPTSSPPVSLPISSRAAEISSAVNHMPPASLPWGYPESHRERQWEEEKKKLQSITRQAEDVMTKISEATVDTMLTAMEALKVKLAEHRLQREEAQRELEKKLEEQRNVPHRFV